MAQCAFALITDERRVLLVQIAPPFRQAHCWNFPGGVIEPGEDIEAGLIREIYEETGATCSIQSLLDTFTTTDPDNEIFIYKATFLSGELIAQEGELLSVGWFTLDEALKLPLAFNISSYLKDVQKSSSAKASGYA